MLLPSTDQHGHAHANAHTHTRAGARVTLHLYWKTSLTKVTNSVMKSVKRLADVRTCVYAGLTRMIAQLF